MSKDMSWPERLELGNKKEEVLVHLFNLSRVPAKRINDTEETKTGIDIELTEDNMYVDSKYLSEVFDLSFPETGIQPFNCLTVSIDHINNYHKKEKETSNEAWIACLVDYPDYEIYEYVFFPNTYLKKQVDNRTMVRAMLSGKWVLHFDRRLGLDFHSFLDYIKKKREMKIFIN